MEMGASTLRTIVVDALNPLNATQEALLTLEREHANIQAVESVTELGACQFQVSVRVTQTG
jgi:hypothetical protein